MSPPVTVDHLASTITLPRNTHKMPGAQPWVTHLTFDKYIRTDEQVNAPATNNGWDRISRECNLVGEALRGIPDAAVQAFNSPDKTLLEIGVAGGLSAALAMSRGRTGALATTVRALGIGVAVTTVADLGKNLIPVTIAAGQAWESDSNFEDNKRVARENLAPLCFSMGLATGSAFAGGYLGAKFHPTVLEPGLTTSTTSTVKSTEALTTQAELRVPLGRETALSVVAEALPRRNAILPGRNLKETVLGEWLEPAVADIRKADFTTPQARRGLIELREKFGQPPTKETTAIQKALSECDISWNQFHKVIQSIRASEFGWPCIEALPIVRELHAKYPGLREPVLMASKFKPESLQPIRDIYYAANVHDRPHIVEYLRAQYQLQVLDRSPTLMAFCDKWPAYDTLVREFSGMPRMDYH